MSRLAILLVLLCIAPYLHMYYVWFHCDCSVSGDYAFWSLLLLLGSPVVLAIIALATLGGSMRALRSGLKKGDMRSIAGGGIGTYWGVSVAVFGIVVSVLVLYPFFEEPEPGRDKLGRICDTNELGTSRTCRPDPDREGGSTFADLEKKGAEKGRAQHLEQQDEQELQELGWGD